MSPSEALCGDVTKALPSGATSGCRSYTGLGRAVKLSSTAILPPSTAGSAHFCVPKEAKGDGITPLIVRKQTSLPKMEKVPTQFSWHYTCSRFTLSTKSFLVGHTLSFPF